MSASLASGGTMFLNGVIAPMRGLGLLLSSSRLKPFAVAPLAIALVVFIAVFSFGIPFIAGALGGWITSGVGLIGLAGLAASGIFMFFAMAFGWIAALAGLGFVALVLTRLLAAPFAALLAERALIELGVIKDQPFALGTWLRVNAAQLWIALIKAIAFGVVALVLFVMSFIPGVAIFTAIGFLMIAAYDVFDPAFDALNLPFGERISYFRGHWPGFMGFGLIFLVPGLSFLLFPALIVGACDVVRRNNSAVTKRAGGNS